MYLTKFDPFESLTGLQNEMDRFLGHPLTKRANKNSQVDWLPAVDIHQDNEGYYFDLEAPGLEKDNFDVSMEDNTLSIKGERKHHSEEKKKNFYRIEREYGTFARSFTLPETADSERVSAEYKNGILHVKVGKKEAVRPKKISVTTA